MAIYTTSLEVIVYNLCDDRTRPLDECIESARNKIFDFEYPCPDTFYKIAFKKYFETQFINEYLFREIGQETVARFKQRLKTKCNLIMPRYKTIFDMLDSIDWDKAFENLGYDETLNTDYSAEYKGKNHNEGKYGNREASSRLPENLLAKGEIYDFTNVGYADNANVGVSNNESDTTSDNSNKSNTDTVIHRGGRTMSYATFLSQLPPKTFKYFESLIKEFDDLFFILFY